MPSLPQNGGVESEGDNKFSGLCEKLEDIKKRGGAGRRAVCVCVCGVVKCACVKHSSMTSSTAHPSGGPAHYSN